MFTDPVVAVPVASEPILADPVVPDPVAAPLGGAEPVTAQPVAADPQAAEPSLVRPESDGEVPTATAEMSLALEDLGFSPDEVMAPELESAPEPEPVEAELASSTWNVTDEIAPLVLPGPQGSDPEQMDAAPEAYQSTIDFEPEAVQEIVARDTDSETSNLDPAPAPTLTAPAAGAPPVTGELNWEQLMWEATQDVTSDTESDAAPKIDQADASDQADHTGPVPSEEQ